MTNDERMAEERRDLLPTTRAELTKNCLYYKGETECPYEVGDRKVDFWHYEKMAVDYLLRECDTDLCDLIEKLTVDYIRAGFDVGDKPNPDFLIRVILYSRYEHWSYLPTREGFEEWYNTIFSSLAQGNQTTIL